MFEKLADKLNKRIQPDEEITFKNFDEETAPVKEEVKSEEPMGSTEPNSVDPNKVALRQMLQGMKGE